MIIIMAKNDDLSGDTIAVNDHAEIYSESDKKQEDETLESVDTFLRDPETEIVFVRKRSKLNEKLRMNDAMMMN